MKEEDLPQEAREQLARLRTLDQQAEAVVRGLQKRLAQIRMEAAAEGERLDAKREALTTLIADKVSGAGLIADAWADYETAIAQAEAEKLRIKGQPAKKAAAELRAKGKELAVLRRQAKLAEWVVALYEWHFPWLADLRDDEEERSFLGTATTPEDKAASDDPVGDWLSTEEWKCLPEVERNQRALDRYLISRKSAWHVGRDYERYVGYLREREGWQVSYHGIFAGLEDLGRDLICERGDQIEVVQCKRWARHKTIHERHVFQTFGTATALRIDRPDKTITASFVTTTKLSERAREFAQQLGLAVYEGMPLEDYPRIKCNVARPTGERIYHLPMDQQYDATVIDSDGGEMWAWTVAEAEEAGFRRAWRWRETPDGRS